MNVRTGSWQRCAVMTALGLKERVMWKKGSGQHSGDARGTGSAATAISSREGGRERELLAGRGQELLRGMEAAMGPA